MVPIDQPLVADHARKGLRSDHSPVDRNGAADGDSWKRAVIRRFGSAVPTYDRDARLQEQVAGSLDSWLADLIPQFPVRKALEIGCGTGMLTRRVLSRWPRAQWLITDLVPEMVDQCQASFPAESRTARFEVLDGEEVGRVAAPLDLIVSSLAVQWFGRPIAAVRTWKELLGPGGWLVFSTLTAGPIPGISSLSGLPSYKYPAAGDWKSGLEDDRCEVHTMTREYCERHTDVRSFLKTLQRIGASTPPVRSRATLSMLRRAILDSRRGGTPLDVEYDVVFVAMQRL